MLKIAKICFCPRVRHEDDLVPGDSGEGIGERTSHARRQAPVGAVRSRNSPDRVPGRDGPSARHPYDNPAAVVGPAGPGRPGSGADGEPRSRVGTPPVEPDTQRLPQSGEITTDGRSESTRGERAQGKILKHHEAQQVGYQLGAKLNGDPITDPRERRCLRDLTEAMHNVRTGLRFGRHEVQDDLWPSGGHSWIGPQLARSIGESLARAQGRECAIAGRSATAVWQRAGAAEDFATLTAIAHSVSLDAGEAAHVVVNGSVERPGHPSGVVRGIGRVGNGHTWCEVRPPRREGVRPSPIVGDSWSNGPAARLEHTLWATGAKASRIQNSFDKRDGDRLLGKVMEMHLSLEPGGVLHDAMLGELREHARAPEPVVRGPEVQVIHEEFAKGAREILTAKSDIHQQILAAGTAREAYDDLSVREAANPKTIQEILHEAKNLDRQDRPPIPPPPFSYLEEAEASSPAPDDDRAFRLLLSQLGRSS